MCKSKVLLSLFAALLQLAAASAPANPVTGPNPASSRPMVPPQEAKPVAAVANAAPGPVAASAASDVMKHCPNLNDEHVRKERMHIDPEDRSSLRQHLHKHCPLAKNLPEEAFESFHSEHRHRGGKPPGSGTMNMKKNDFASYEVAQLDILRVTKLDHEQENKMYRKKVDKDAMAEHAAGVEKDMRNGGSKWGKGGAASEDKMDGQPPAGNEEDVMPRSCSHPMDKSCAYNGQKQDRDVEADYRPKRREDSRYSENGASQYKSERDGNRRDSKDYGEVGRDRDELGLEGRPDRRGQVNSYDRGIDAERRPKCCGGQMDEKAPGKGEQKGNLPLSQSKRDDAFLESSVIEADIEVAHVEIVPREEYERTHGAIAAAASGPARPKDGMSGSEGRPRRNLKNMSASGPARQASSGSDRDEPRKKHADGGLERREKRQEGRVEHRELRQEGRVEHREKRQENREEHREKRQENREEHREKRQEGRKEHEKPQERRKDRRGFRHPDRKDHGEGRPAAGINDSMDSDVYFYDPDMRQFQQQAQDYLDFGCGGKLGKVQPRHHKRNGGSHRKAGAKVVNSRKQKD